MCKRGKISTVSHNILKGFPIDIDMFFGNDLSNVALSSKNGDFGKLRAWQI